MTRLERNVNVAAVFVPIAGFVVAVVVLWNDAVGVRDLAIMAALYALTDRHHRRLPSLLTHRSFEAPAVAALPLAMLGSMAVQGPVIDWVADHRKHHALHRPGGRPAQPAPLPRRGAARGFGLWHAHVGWLFPHAGQARRAAMRTTSPDRAS